MKKDIQKLIFDVLKRIFLPDLTNKITWSLVTLGSFIILDTTALKLLFLNWLVDTVNLNAGEHFTFADLQSGSASHFYGFVLILLALIYNITQRFLIYKEQYSRSEEARQIQAVDKQLFEQFLVDLPSDGLTVELLKEHNFGASHHRNSIKQLDTFVDRWNIPEKAFLDQELETKRKSLWEKYNTFSYALADGSYSLPGGTMYSCIPEAYRSVMDLPEKEENKIRKLNQMAKECFRLHEEFVLLGRRKLRC